MRVGRGGDTVSRSTPTSMTHMFVGDLFLLIALYLIKDTKFYVDASVDRVTDNILAMARPSTKQMKENNILDQFVK